MNTPIQSWILVIFICSPKKAIWYGVNVAVYLQDGAAAATVRAPPRRAGRALGEARAPPRRAGRALERARE